MKVKVLQGDCIEQLKTIEDKRVHCCVTSPPYWGLRDYGHESQLGLEATPEDYVTKMVQVFREVRRVLRDDGTLWLNLGDSYARSAGNEESKLASLHTMGVGQKKAHEAGAMRKGKNRPPEGLKPKDLIGIPWRVAFALQADGWYLRQDIIWHKPNPMPESVTDRCTKSHEYIFLLSKSANYYFDQIAIQEPLACSSVARLSQDVDAQQSSDRVPGKTNGRMKAVYSKRYTGQSTKDYVAGGAQDASATKARIVDRILSGQITGRNKRSVWTVTTKPYKGAHFATFPSDLICPCILAGCPKNGIILDPFGGSGTTGQVAMEHGRNAILIELNPQYIGLINRRLADVQPLLLE